MTVPHFEVQLATLPSVPLAVVRKQVSRATLGAAVREGCGTVWTFARERGLAAGRNVAVYWDGSLRLRSSKKCRDGVIRVRYEIL